MTTPVLTSIGLYVDDRAHNWLGDIVRYETDIVFVYNRLCNQPTSLCYYPYLYDSEANAYHQDYKWLHSDSAVGTAIFSLYYNNNVVKLGVSPYEFDKEPMEQSWPVTGLASRGWNEVISATQNIQWTKYFWAVMDFTNKVRFYTVICVAEVITKTGSEPDTYNHDFGAYNQLWSFGSSTRDHDLLNAYYDANRGPVVAGDKYSEWWRYTYLSQIEPPKVGDPVKFGSDS